MIVKKDIKNPLLKRREVLFEMESESNPGFEGAMKAVVNEFKIQEALVVVKKVDSSFGSHKFIIDAFIYDSEDAKNKVEPVKREKKK